MGNCFKEIDCAPCLGIDFKSDSHIAVSFGFERDDIFAVPLVVDMPEDIGKHVAGAVELCKFAGSGYIDFGKIIVHALNGDELITACKIERFKLTIVYDNELHPRAIGEVKFPDGVVAAIQLVKTGAAGHIKLGDSGVCTVDLKIAVAGGKHQIFKGHIPASECGYALAVAHVNPGDIGAGNIYFIDGAQAGEIDIVIADAGIVDIENSKLEVKSGYVQIFDLGIV